MNHNNRQEFELIGGAKLTLMQRPGSTNAYSRKQFLSAPRLYVSVKDETIMENLLNRTTRPFLLYKKMIRTSGVGRVIDIEKLRWSQHAGCSCNCSPGFILPRGPVVINGQTAHQWDGFVSF